MVRSSMLLFAEPAFGVGIVGPTRLRCRDESTEDIRYINAGFNYSDQIRVRNYGLRGIQKAAAHLHHSWENFSSERKSAVNLRQDRCE